MRRRAAALLPVLLVGALAAVPPASAATNACVGAGTATVAPALVYPVTAPTPIALRQPRWAAWSFTPTPGLSTCAPDLAKALTATGLLHGWCGLNTGMGVTGNGHRFAWVNVGGAAVVTGGLVGVAAVQPDVVNGQSCVSGASSFLVEYGVLTTTCVGKFKGLTTSPVPIPPTLTPIADGLIWIHTDGSNHVWWKLCSP